MKLFRTLALFSLFISALILNWNCSDENIDKVNPLKTDKNLDGGDEAVITVRLVVYQQYEPCSSDCPAVIDLLLIDTTVNITNIIYTSITTLDSIYVHPSCGNYCKTSWRVERYVTWSNIGYNNFGYWQVNNDIQRHELVPVSGGSYSKINYLTNMVCNSNYTVGVGVDHLSDARDKKNIRDLSLGLGFINKLKPRQFNWDRREWYENNISDGSRMDKNLTAGFIAQELDEAQISQNAEWLKLVFKNNPQQLRITTDNLLPVMIKSIQELNAENNKLNTKLEKLEQSIILLKNNQNTVKLSSRK